MLRNKPDRIVTHEQFRKEIRALRSGTAPAWPRIGRILEEAEARGYWETEGSGSFTEWVRTLAISLGRKERMLWRYLSAARFYGGQLRPLLEERKVAAPPLVELPAGVSPEKLELLSKLARVAPDQILEPLGRRTLQGNISRVELIRAWEAFRPALGGRTARGRSTPNPQIDEHDPDQHAAQSKAIVCHALQAAGSQWTGSGAPKSYEVFLDVRPEPASEIPSDYVFDAVAVIVPQAGPVELHGVEVWGTGPVHTSVHGRTQLAEYCDYFWFAQGEPAGLPDPKRLPEGVGLLVSNKGQIEVKRVAVFSGKSGRQREALLAGLLVRAMER